MTAAETVRRALRWLHAFAHHYLCIGVAILLIAANILFFLAVSVICVMVAIDAMVTLLYQMAMPPTSGMAVVSVLLCAVATPWIVAFVATVMDWRHWPVWYRPLVESLRAVSACCCGGAFVPLTAPTESFTLNSLLPRAGTSKCLGLVTAWRWLCGRRGNADGEETPDDDGVIDDDTAPAPSPAPRVAVQQEPSEQTLLEPGAVGPHPSASQSFMDRVAEAKSGAIRAHLRIIVLYACPLAILIIATAFNFGSSTGDTGEGTQLFIILSALFAVLNAVVHLEQWAVRPMQDSVRAFVIFRPEGRNISTFAVAAGLAAMLSILAQDSTMVRGGTGAAVAVIIVSVLVFIGNVFVNLRRPGGFNRPTFQPRRSKYLRAIAAIDCLVLLASAISIGAIFTSKDATLVWLLLGTVVVLHASVWVNDEKVQLHLALEEQLEAQAIEAGRMLSPQQTLQRAVNALDAQSRSLLLRSLRRGGARDLRRVGDVTFERPDDAPAGLEIQIDGVPVVVDAAHSGALEAGMNSKELTYGGVDGDAAADEDEAEEAPTGNSKKRQFRRFLLARRIAHSVVVFISLVIVGFTFVDGTTFYTPVACGPKLYPGEGANKTNRYHVEYDVCGIRMSDFSVVDFAAAAAASYANNTTAAMQVYFPNDGVVRIDGAGASNAKAFIGVAYSIVRFPKRNATMVIIRGSYRSVDWLQNVYLMSDSLVLQLGTAMLPLPFSMSLEATIVSLISSLKFGMNTYASSVLAGANRAQARFPNDTIYVVGHSLGGFTANIVAAQGNFQGVAFSPMGTGMQYKRFGFPVRTADMTLLSVVPEHDLVPKVDVQLGMVQQIVSIAPCDFSNMFCHSMQLTMTTLATNCGDPLGRTVDTCPP